ncbi:MAG TPA: hypothetical protein VKE95_05580 [Burkholderiales bacterium]|nr:hypothetical protein [Burkholderiales bacterium]
MRNGIPITVVAAALAILAGCEGGTGPTTSYKYGGSASAGQRASLRYQFDAKGERVWWLTRDGVVVKNIRAMERTAVRLPDWTWVGEAWSCAPDLALGPRGEALVTSNIVPIVWKIDPETMAVTEHALVLDADTDKDFGFTGLTYSAEHDAYFAVSGNLGTLWKIDAQLTRAEKVALSGPIYNACRVAPSGRAASQASGPAVGLCVGGTQRNWTVDVALADRTANVRATACTDLAWRIGQLAMTDQ